MFESKALPRAFPRHWEVPQLIQIQEFPTALRMSASGQQASFLLSAFWGRESTALSNITAQTIPTANIT